MAYPYFVPDRLVVAPPFEHIDRGLVKHVIMRGEDFLSFSYHQVQDSLLLYYMRQTTGSLVLDKLMVVCFRPCGDEGYSYIKEVLKRGVCLDGACYRFLGQGKDRLRGKTCFLVTENDLVIYDFLSRFINFSEVKGVTNRAGCLDLLMTGFKKTVSLKFTDCSVLKDTKKGKYNFTQGCGFMSIEFAAEIQMKEGLQLPPCAVLGMYQGFYGTLVIRTNLNECKVEFRESMKKFSVSDEELRNDLTTFAVLDYSRPYTNGYLNIQTVMLLADRGVSHDYLKQLQEDYYTMLENLCTNRSRAAYFLRTTGNTELLRILQSSDPQAIQKELEKLRKAEILNMKCCDQLDGGRRLPNSNLGLQTRLRVLVPKSRVVLGVCDPYGKLKSGECYFSPTMSDEEEGEYSTVEKVVILRSPCYHSGDIRVLKVRRKQAEYSYLKDCIVFPVQGTRPHALECGGANLAGSKFFVTWDTNLVPTWNEAPFDYSPKPVDKVNTRLSRSTQPLSRLSGRVRNRAQRSLPSVFGDRDSYQKRKKVKVLQEMAGHFADASNDSLCKLDATFMKYAALVGPSSKECRHIHQHLVNALSGQTKGEELEKVCDKHEHDLQAYEALEKRPRSSSMQRLRVRLGLTRPVFQPGDDVWEAMELRAKDFYEQVSPFYSERRGSMRSVRSMADRASISSAFDRTSSFVSSTKVDISKQED
ncbi:probable RNA-dependent RNA polymerase 1 [Exaiptasia diaphana]|uniref:RNA-dependent RNA polymerase n=1 Tax=Exaiptasia diaphana TaxID=2652724 RepID=A0A913YXY8_EXADI|nr:probable RNA-dependent RNA polymerase 1 [Exaiptasia diaphana]XP_028518956.1 probable RNA-dependent RNA polymerase 1 [Exaiptasia diaphana]KXJ29076.1 putative RNA-dependent RNA polymerase 1 [Exaiptasia diaphana]